MSELDAQFHKLWGQAKEQSYDKPAWIEMQRLMEEWAEEPKWFAAQLLKLWPLLQVTTQAELLVQLKKKRPKVYDLIAEALVWHDFTADFDYDKKFYDVQLQDGTIVEKCWPNAGGMNESMNPDAVADRRFMPKDNVKVRLSLRHPMDD